MTSNPQLEKKVDKLEGIVKQLVDDVKFYAGNAERYLTSLQLSTAENDRIKQENQGLKKKLNILPLRPKPKNIPIMTERDKQIIEQAKAHLEPLTNAKTLRERILKAEEVNTKEAYWDLHTDLRSGGSEYQKKLIQFFQQDLDQATSFVYTLGAVLRGERLENK